MRATRRQRCGDQTLRILTSLSRILSGMLRPVGIGSGCFPSLCSVGSWANAVGLSSSWPVMPTEFTPPSMPSLDSHCRILKMLVALNSFRLRGAMRSSSRHIWNDVQTEGRTGGVGCSTATVAHTRHVGGTAYNITHTPRRSLQLNVYCASRIYNKLSIP